MIEHFVSIYPMTSPIKWSSADEYRLIMFSCTLAHDDVVKIESDRILANVPHPVDICFQFNNCKCVDDFYYTIKLLRRSSKDSVSGTKKFLLANTSVCLAGNKFQLGN